MSKYSAPEPSLPHGERSKPEETFLAAPPPMRVPVHIPKLSGSLKRGPVGINAINLGLFIPGVSEIIPPSKFSLIVH